MAKVVVILTCYNRKEKTLACLRSLLERNTLLIDWVIVDDQSTDGTVDAVKELIPRAHIVKGTGKLFWNGGMHIGMEYAAEEFPDHEYYVLINDDVEFVPGILPKMIEELDGQNYALVGATHSSEGKLSYGGILYPNPKRLKFRMVGPDESALNCSTMNANCVVLPSRIFKEVGATDPEFTHSMGDFDYGFRVRRAGFEIHTFTEYVGECNDNPTNGTWQDRSLPRKKRLQLKESPKGLPRKDWYRFLRKNFGLATALFRSVTPYLKILLGR